MSTKAREPTNHEVAQVIVKVVRRSHGFLYCCYAFQLVIIVYKLLQTPINIVVLLPYHLVYKMT